MSAPTREEALKHRTGDYVAGHAYPVDELVLLDWLTLHFYGETEADGRCLWLNFRLLEVMQLDDQPLYAAEEHVRPGVLTKDARAAYAFASGFIKWDGCCEIEMDHHMCGVHDARQVTAALLHVFSYAAEQHGFESCE